MSAAPFEPNIAPQDKQRFSIDDGWHFGMARTIRWSDVDAFGHCNNLSHLRFYQDVRNFYVESAGLPRVASDVPGPVIAHLEADYLRPLGYGDPIMVTARVSRLGRTSFSMEYAVWHDGCHSRGSAECVLMINDTGEKVPIPDAVRAAIIALDSPDH